MRGRNGASNVGLLAAELLEGSAAGDSALVSEPALSASPDCISSVGLDSVVSVKPATHKEGVRRACAEQLQLAHSMFSTRRAMRRAGPWLTLFRRHGGGPELREERAQRVY